MICPQCGKEASGNFCSNCGARLAAAPPPVATEAPPAAPPLAAGTPAPSDPPPAAPGPAPASAAPTHPSSSLCPVCRRGTLQAKVAREILHTKHELVCDRCGATFVDHGGEPHPRLELADTRNPAEPNWQRYKHQTLLANEWYAIACGGASHAETQEAVLAAAMTELRAGHFAPQDSGGCPILLKGGEQAIFVLGGVALHEPRSVTRGAYGGPSIHVAKGLTLRVGGFQAQSHEELKAIDGGTLVLTTKRLCFSGRLRSLEVDLRKLISVDAYSDAVAIRRSGKEKTEFFFGLDHHTYSFAVQDRRYTEPMSGLILKYAIEGLLAQAG
jgi:hypothetical protein